MPAAVRVLAFGAIFGVLVAILAFVGPGRVAAQDRSAPKRLALVIGEAAYPQARLVTADADAGLMATAFAQAGFDVVAVADADAATLRRTIADLAAKARSAGPGAVLAVYVSGYGLQYAGENWLVPVGARIDTDADVPEAAMRLAELAGPLEDVPATTRLFLFDLSRATPFARNGMPLAGGLSLAEAPVGSIYAYNTAPGVVAPANVPPYGSYARALAEAMQVPGLPPGEMLRRVRLRVGERTDGAAVPFDDGSADPSFAFFPGARADATALPAIAGLAAPLAYSTAIARDTLPGYADFVTAFPRDPLVGRVRAMAAARREALFWSEAVRANTPRAYWTYMRRYPRGPHLGDVRRQLFALHAALEPPPRFDIVPFEGLPPPSSEEVAALERLTFVDGPSIPSPPATMLPPPRSAFFDTLPPPPLAPAGSLPLPLPVATPEGQARPFGAIEEPAVPGGALIATLRDDRGGCAIVTARPGGTVVSRLSATVAHSVRTVNQTAADGAAISRVAISTGGDGALTMIQVGPADRPLGRSVNRDVAVGGHAITLLDAGGQVVAATVVSAADIVTTNGVISGKALPPRFVIVASGDAKGGPAIAPEALGIVPSASPMPATPTPAAPKPKGDAGKSEAPRPEASRSGEAKDAAGKANPAPPSHAGALKPPALPAAAGLTGQAPALNLPPPPPAPAFDGAAAPLAAVPAPPESAAGSPAGPPFPSTSLAMPPAPAPVPAAAATAPAAPPPPPAPSPSAAPIVPPAVSKAIVEPTHKADTTPGAARLPSDPPLPPRRARSGAKPRAGR